MEEYHGNTVEYWKHKAEKDYPISPISVLKYIGVNNNSPNSKSFILL